MPACGFPRCFFDRRDHEPDPHHQRCERRKRDLDYIRKQYYGYFHPHGIKEMVESRSLRIAYAWSTC